MNSAVLHPVKNCATGSLTDAAFNSKEFIEKGSNFTIQYNPVHFISWPFINLDYSESLLPVSLGCSLSLSNSYFLKTCPAQTLLLAAHVPWSLFKSIPFLILEFKAYHHLALTFVSSPSSSHSLS